MAYTPELSFKSSCTLRRISWALGVPMTKGIEFVFDYLPKILDSEKVCQACRDKSKCSTCEFNFRARIHDETEKR
jgi:hypothetical protein